MFKVTFDKSDILFSKCIRLRDGYTCVRCKRFFPDGKGLENSHFFNRIKESVRFDPENCDSLCTSCHMDWEHKKGTTIGEYEGRQVEISQEYRAWKKKQLGEERFLALEVRANAVGKKDRKLALLRCEEWWKQLNTALVAREGKVWGRRAE